MNAPTITPTPPAIDDIRRAALEAWEAQAHLNALIADTIATNKASRNAVAPAAGMTRRGVDYAIADAALTEVGATDLRPGDEVRYTRTDSGTAPLMRRTWKVERAYGPAIGQDGHGVLLRPAGNRADPWLIEGRDYTADTRFLVAR